jgi:hypothetical protein
VLALNKVRDVTVQRLQDKLDNPPTSICAGGVNQKLAIQDIPEIQAEGLSISTTPYVAVERGLLPLDSLGSPPPWHAVMQGPHACATFLKSYAKILHPNSLVELGMIVGIPYTIENTALVGGG